MEGLQSQITLDPGSMASIVIVGLPGVGKSTLGVIASTSLRMRLVETDRCFQTMTGTTAADFLQDHGREALKIKEHEVLQKILEKHSRDSVVVVGSRLIDIQPCKALLETFSKSHRVIHVTRDLDHLVQHLKTHSSGDGILKMYNRGILQYRSLAAFEFCVNGWTSADELGSDSQIPQFLYLKAVERSFLGFLRFIYGGTRYSTFLCAPENTEFSRILSIDMSQDERSLLQSQDIYGVHAIKLELDFRNVNGTCWSSIVSRISMVSSILRDHCDVPLALNVKHAFQNNRISDDDEARHFALLEHAVALGFDYCYLDLHSTRQRAVDFMKRSRSTKVIGFWHQKEGTKSEDSRSWWTSSDPFSIYWMALELGCAVLQMSAEAKLMQDNYDLLRFVTSVNKNGSASGMKLSAFNTGEVGRLSRVLNRTLNPVIPSTQMSYVDESIFDAGTEVDGIITTKEVQRGLTNSFIIKALKFRSFGGLISHSVGPAIHNAAFSALGLPHRYELTETTDLAQSIKIMQAPDFGGLSCANPHKHDMIALLDSISDHARAIKAVNTVYPRKSSCGHKLLLHGENTDWIGVTYCVKNSLSPVNTVTNKTTALVIGAGGMAHAAVYAMLQLGVTKIFIHNRTLRHAEDLVRHFRSVAQKLDEKKKSKGSKEKLMSATPDQFVVVASVHDSGMFSRGTNPPTIIINTLPDGIDEPISSVFDLPPDWFGHSSGGVYIEVRLSLTSIVTFPN